MLLYSAFGGGCVESEKEGYRTAADGGNILFALQKDYFLDDSKMNGKDIDVDYFAKAKGSRI